MLCGYEMSANGSIAPFDRLPATSGLPRSTDINRPARMVRFVPETDSRTAARLLGHLRLAEASDLLYEFCSMRQGEFERIRVIMADDRTVGVLLDDAMSVEGTEVHGAAIFAKEPPPLLAWRFREAVRQNEVERTFAFMAATVDASSRIPTEEQTVAFTAKAPVALGERRFGDVVWKVEIESLCLMLSARYARSLGGREMHDAASNAPLEPVGV